jgi:hypothetical protein
MNRSNVAILLHQTRGAASGATFDPPLELALAYLDNHDILNVGTLRSSLSEVLNC